MSIISLDISIFIMQVIHVPCKRYDKIFCSKMFTLPVVTTLWLFGHLFPFCSHFQLIRLFANSDLEDHIGAKKHGAVVSSGSLGRHPKRDTQME